MISVLYICDKTFYEQKMSRVRFHSMEAIGKQCNLMWWGPNWDGWKNGSIVSNLKNIISPIDLIVVYKPLDIADDWDKVNVPICLRYNETYDVPWTKKEITESNASFVIFHHEHDLYGNISDYRKDMPHIDFSYIPHSAEKTIFKPMPDIEKQYDILLVGARGFSSQALGTPHYPIRDRMNSLLEKIPGEFRVGRFSKPHARVTNAYNNHTAIDFARAINSSKICITDSGAPKSRFGKYIEIPMCGTVIVGDIPNDDQENFRKFIIEINNDMSDEEIISKITEHLNDSSKLEQLKNIGLEWSRNYTQEKYAERFIKEASSFLTSDRYKIFQEWESSL